MHGSDVVSIHHCMAVMLLAFVPTHRCFLQAGQSGGRPERCLRVYEVAGGNETGAFKFSLDGTVAVCQMYVHTRAELRLLLVYIFHTERSC